MSGKVESLGFEVLLSFPWTDRDFGSSVTSQVRRLSRTDTTFDLHLYHGKRGRTGVRVSFLNPDLQTRMEDGATSDPRTDGRRSRDHKDNVLVHPKRETFVITTRLSRLTGCSLLRSRTWGRSAEDPGEDRQKEGKVRWVRPEEVW